MPVDSIPTIRPHDSGLLLLCVAGSLVAHLLALTLLPRWQALREAPPRPLTVELARPEPPDIVPPKPLPMEPRPDPVKRETPKPLAKAPPPEAPVHDTVLTAPPEAPPSPAAAVVPVQPEPRPAPPLPVEAPKTAPAPVTPPRSDASYLNNPRPVYPLAARRRGDQGTVLVRVVVTADGLAASVGLDKSSGHPSLDEAALTAVKSWRFVPARQGGQPIESPYVVPVVFRLD